MHSSTNDSTPLNVNISADISESVLHRGEPEKNTNSRCIPTPILPYSRLKLWNIWNSDMFRIIYRLTLFAEVNQVPSSKKGGYTLGHRHLEFNGLSFVVFSIRSRTFCFSIFNLKSNSSVYKCDSAGFRMTFSSKDTTLSRYETNISNLLIYAFVQS